MLRPPRPGTRTRNADRKRGSVEPPALTTWPYGAARSRAASAISCVLLAASVAIGKTRRSRTTSFRLFEIRIILVARRPNPTGIRRGSPRRRLFNGRELSRRAPPGTNVKVPSVRPVRRSDTVNRTRDGHNVVRPTE